MRKVSTVFVGAAAIAIASAVVVPSAAYAQDKDIVETAVAAGNFKTFTKLVADAGLTATLKGPGPFTVFAPTDEAFAKIPADKMAALSKDPRALRNVLLYHIVAGKLMAADIAKMDGKGQKTVEGSETKVMMMGSAVMLNNSNVTRSDVITKNGVMHVIDAVMMPPGK